MKIRTRVVSGFLLSSFCIAASACIICVPQVRAEDQPTPSESSEAKASDINASESKVSGGTVLDMVLASVDGEPVTLSDLRRFIESHGGTPPDDVQSGDFEIRSHLRELVVDSLIRKEAQAAGISVDKGEIDAYVREIKKQNGVDDDGFDEILRTKGLTREEYHQQVTNDITRARILSSKVRAKINIVDEDIQRYLDEHPEMMPEKGSVHLKQIVLRDDSPELSSDEERKAHMLEVREKLVAGGSWSELGGDNYQDLGFVKIPELREELQEAVRNLEVGEVSPLIKTATSYQLLIVAAKNEGDGIDPAIKSKVTEILFQTRYKDEVDKFLNDELPKKYHVELKL